MAKIEGMDEYIITNGILNIIKYMIHLVHIMQAHTHSTLTLTGYSYN